MSTETKVGIFSLIILIIIGWASFKLGKWSIGPKRGYSIYAIFDSAALVELGAPVLFAGVKIGKVENVDLYNRRGRIWMRIDPGIEIPSNAIVWQRTEGFLGVKYLEIIPQSILPPTEPLKDGEELKDARMPILETVSDRLELVSAQIEQVTRTLSQVLGTKEGEKSLNEILENFRYLSESLVITLEGRDKQLDQVMNNMEQFSKDLTAFTKKNIDYLNKSIAHFPEITQNFKEVTYQFEKIAGDFSKIIDENRDDLRKVIKEDLKEIVKISEENLTNLNNLLNSFKNISEGIEEGRGTIGKLIKDEETIDNLNTAISGINEFLLKAKTLKTHIGIRSEYLTGANNAKTYISLKLQPKPDKYYRLQLIDDPIGRFRHSESVTHKKVLNEEGEEITEYKTLEEEDRIDSRTLFSFELARRYRNFTIRGGMIENTGGIGLDYAFFNDMLTISFESFDFGASTYPHLKGSANLSLWNHIDLIGGVDDFINKDRDVNFFLGAGIHFEDSDITTLITSLPIPNF